MLESAVLPKWLTQKNKVTKMLRWAPCSLEHVCSTNTRWRVDPNDNEHMRNWVQKFDLVCRTDKTKLMMPLMAAGIMLGLLFSPSHADHYGRKQVFLVSLMSSLIT